MEHEEALQLVEKLKFGMQKINALFSGELPASGKVTLTYQETDEETGKVTLMSLMIPDAKILHSALETYFCRVHPKKIEDALLPIIEDVANTK